MTHADVTDTSLRYLVDDRARPAATPRRSRRERVVRWLGYRVYEPPKGPDVGFLASAPELAGAIRSGCARFSHVACAGWLARHARDDGERATLQREYANLLEDFERHAGRMRRWYFGDTKLLGAALTEDDQISVLVGARLHPCRPEVVDLVRCCQQVGYTAWHRLAPYDRRLCQDMVFSVIEEAFRMLEAGPDEEPEGCVKALGERLKQAEQFMLRCASRRAQSHYLKGVLWGTVGIGAVLATLMTVLLVGHHMTRFGGELLLVSTAGAVGAAISVPMRMTSGSFRMNLPTLNAEMKGTDVRLVASLRPVMGLVLALATYAVVLAGLVPMESNADPIRQTALYVAIGFLSGFTERFAQDMFVRSGKGLEGVMGDSPSTGPSAGISPQPGVQVEGVPAPRIATA